MLPAIRYYTFTDYVQQGRTRMKAAMLALRYGAGVATFMRSLRGRWP